MSRRAAEDSFAALRLGLESVKVTHRQVSARQVLANSTQSPAVRRVHTSQGRKVPMFGQPLKLGSILGIPFRIDYSWFLIFVLIAMSLAGEFTSLHPEWVYAQSIAFGLITGLLFFASVVAH